MSQLFWMLASDVVTYCMMPLPSQYLKQERFETNPRYAHIYRMLAKLVLWNRHYFGVFDLLYSLPRFFMIHKSVSPFVEVLDMQNVRPASPNVDVTDHHPGLITSNQNVHEFLI